MGIRQFIIPQYFERDIEKSLKCYLRDVPVGVHDVHVGTGLDGGGGGHAGVSV